MFYHPVADATSFTRPLPDSGKEGWIYPRREIPTNSVPRLSNFWVVQDDVFPVTTGHTAEHMIVLGELNGKNTTNYEDLTEHP